MLHISKCERADASAASLYFFWDRAYAMNVGGSSI